MNLKASFKGKILKLINSGCYGRENELTRFCREFIARGNNIMSEMVTISQPVDYTTIVFLSIHMFLRLPSPSSWNSIKVL